MEINLMLRSPVPSAQKILSSHWECHSNIPWQMEQNFKVHGTLRETNLLESSPEKTIARNSWHTGKLLAMNLFRLTYMKELKRRDSSRRNRAYGMVSQECNESLKTLVAVFQSSQLCICSTLNEWTLIE